MWWLKENFLARTSFTQCVLMGVCVQMREGNVNMYDDMVTAVVRKAAGNTIAPFNEFKRPKIKRLVK